MQKPYGEMGWEWRNPGAAQPGQRLAQKYHLTSSMLELNRGTNTRSWEWPRRTSKVLGAFLPPRHAHCSAELLQAMLL